MTAREGYRNPIPTTDTIIEYSDGKTEGIVLITRKNPPYGIALPGGFAEFGLSLEENAMKEAWEETGLEVVLEDPEEPLCVHSNPARDIRSHMISVTYIGKGRGKIEAGDDASDARLYSIEEVRGLIKTDGLAFDHARALEKYIIRRGYLGKAGVIGRFKPLHNGGAVLLEELCRKSDSVVIGIGSANMHDIRNPFTAEESMEMIDAYLSGKFSNYKMVPVDQFGHMPQYSDGARWTEEVLKIYGGLDTFATANQYVSQLLKPHYMMLESYLLVPPEKRAPLSATDVRTEIARGGNWRAMVPEEAAKYIDSHNLAERFRAEYGLETLAMLAENYHSPHGMKDEKAAVTGA